MEVVGYSLGTDWDQWDDPGPQDYGYARQRSGSWTPNPYGDVEIALTPEDLALYREDEDKFREQADALANEIVADELPYGVHAEWDITVVNDNVARLEMSSASYDGGEGSEYSRDVNRSWGTLKKSDYWIPPSAEEDT